MGEVLGQDFCQKGKKTKTSFLPEKVVCEPCNFHVN